MRNFIFLITFFSLFACKKEVEKLESKSTNKKTITKTNRYEKHSYDEKIKSLKSSMPKNSILSNDIQFINDSILKGKFKLDISQYEIENAKKNCFPTILKKEEFYEYSLEADRNSTKQFKNLGDLNGDGKNESVFILPGLGWCEEGQSYYFTDNKIPRIVTDSNCCHPESIIYIGDIDEDGNMEIAEYYSSCASRYKAITIYSIKNSKWNEIKSFSFVLNDEYSIEKDFKKLFRKTSKNHLECYEIKDVNIENELVASWIKIKI
jgi:hypothetical protein